MKKHHCNPVNCYDSLRNIRILTMLILICFVFSTISNVHALEFLQKHSNTDPITVINAYSDSDIIFSVDSSKQLRSISTNENEYTLYSLKPYGYAILFNENNNLMEACYQEGVTAPINLSDSFAYYYAGPTAFLLADDDNFVDISTNRTLTEAEIGAIKQVESNVITFERNISKNVTDFRSSTITHNVNQGYFENLVDFGNNVNGTCTVLAISILLRYYDYFINDNYVHIKHHQGTGTSDSFHQELIDLVYDPDEDDFGLYISGAVNAIDEYLGMRGINAYLDNDSTISLNTNRIVDAVISLLSANKPVVASMSTYNGGSFDHTVVVYGVTYNTTDKYGSAVYRMHTGWHGNSTTQPRILTASASWFYQYGSLECYYIDHQYTNYHEFTNSQHRSVCDCSAEILQAHSMTQTINGRKCTLCGYQEGNSIMSIEDMQEG